MYADTLAGGRERRTINTTPSCQLFFTLLLNILKIFIRRRWALWRIYFTYYCMSLQVHSLQAHLRDEICTLFCSRYDTKHLCITTCTCSSPPQNPSHRLVTDHRTLQSDLCVETCAEGHFDASYKAAKLPSKTTEVTCFPRRKHNNLPACEQARRCGHSVPLLHTALFWSLYNFTIKTFQESCGQVEVTIQSTPQILLSTIALISTAQTALTNSVYRTYHGGKKHNQKAPQHSE